VSKYIQINQNLFFEVVSERFALIKNSSCVQCPLGDQSVAGRSSNPARRSSASRRSLPRAPGAAPPSLGPLRLPHRPPSCKPLLSASVNGNTPEWVPSAGGWRGGGRGPRGAERGAARPPPRAAGPEAPRRPSPYGGEERRRQKSCPKRVSLPTRMLGDRTALESAPTLTALPGDKTPRLTVSCVFIKTPKSIGNSANQNGNVACPA